MLDLWGGAQAAVELPAGTQVTTATQSDYRESEAQTAPYAPEYQIPSAPSAKQRHLTGAFRIVSNCFELFRIPSHAVGHALQRRGGCRRASRRF
jgi:hypothetical protein